MPCFYGPFALAALLRALAGAHWLVSLVALGLVPLGAVAIVAAWLDPQIPADMIRATSYLGMALISAGVGLIAGRLLGQARGR